MWKGDGTMTRHALARLAPLLVGALAVSASADTITVNAAGGADYTTIGEALAAAVDGDEILVWAGTYTGPNNRNLDFGGKHIHLEGHQDSASRPVIDCEQQGRAFYFHSGENGSSAVYGIEIVNAHCTGSGGAILLDGASPTIEGCVFTNNTATVNGGAIHADGASPEIWDCAFINNTATENGGAICAANSTDEVRIWCCTFSGNTAGLRGGAVMCDHSDVEIDSCLFDGNAVVAEPGSRDYGGGGIHVHGGPVTVTSSTFGANTATAGASAVHSSSGPVTVTNSILAFGVEGAAAEGLLSLTHCDVFGNADGDSLDCDHYENMFVDPRFCDMANGDYTLCANSPCSSESPQNPWGEWIGGFIVDCGACSSAVESTTWGAIKGLYR
jgi:predicted outer membrane repeat protein